jgi:hypothetical protein
MSIEGPSSSGEKQGGDVLDYDAFRPQVDAAGNIVSVGSNNMWSLVAIPTNDDDPMFNANLRGQEIIDAVGDPADKQQIEKLIHEHTTAAQDALNDVTKRRDFMLSDETNRRLYEIYTIARKNGISNEKLLG